MLTIAIASQKGGAGKTTLCLHLSVLAAERGPTLAIDLDPQGSLSFWHSRRQAPTPLLITGTADKLPVYIQAAKQEGIRFCLVDLPPHDSAATAAAMRVADIVLIPARPSALDLHAVSSTLDMVRTLKKRAAVVLSQCPAKRGFGDPQAVTDARKVIVDLGGSVCPVSITARVVAAQSVIAGQAVTEMEPDGAAAREFSSLWQWIEGTAENGKAA